jgi:hypothetical protein
MWRHHYVLPEKQRKIIDAGKLAVAEQQFNMRFVRKELVHR